MRSEKILFITQEITPYVQQSNMSKLGQELPRLMQESGHEVRTFMPRWGTINERRNQLHEVIRLSGMNIIIDDTDHTLIIKVASILSTRMQVYFIDNDDYFHKRKMRTDEDGNEYSDNAERAIFYARGVLETVKKLRWKPGVIHCHGWISSIAPFFIKTAYKEEPAFADAKVVFSACSDELQTPPAENFKECLQFRELPKATIDHLDLDLSSPNALSMLALNYSDGFIQAEEGVSPELMAYAQKLGLPTLNNAEVEDTGKAYADFFERLYE